MPDAKLVGACLGEDSMELLELKTIKLMPIGTAGGYFRRVTILLRTALFCSFINFIN